MLYGKGCTFERIYSCLCLWRDMPCPRIRKCESVNILMGLHLRETNWDLELLISNLEISSWQFVLALFEDIASFSSL